MTGPSGVAPRVSILMPVRDGLQDGGRALESCLRSLSWQTMADWELVVVEDGSVDGTLARLQGWEDPRVRIFPQPRLGLVAALNAGLSRCRAPWVARMDADDVARPDRLARQLAVLEARPDLWALGSRVRIFPVSAVTAGMARYEGWLNELVEHEQIVPELFIESPLVHPSVIFHRDRVLGLGGYQDRGWPEDYDLWLRIWEAGGRLAKDPETLLFWRDWPGRFTRTHPCCHLDRFLELKVEVLLRTHLAGARPIWIWGAGRAGRRWLRELARRGRPVEGWVDDHPGRVGQRIAGLLVRRLEEAPPAGEVMLLVGGARAQARRSARARLGRQGWVEGVDWHFIA